MHQPRQQSKANFPDLLPIKVELGGLTVKNMFARTSLFQNSGQSQNFDEDDRFNGEIEHHDEGEGSNRNEPDPEDDNHVSIFRKVVSIKESKSIFEETSELDSTEKMNNLANGGNSGQSSILSVIEDSRQTRFLLQKLQVIQLSCLMFSIITIILSVIELDVKDMEIADQDQLRKTLLVTISFASIALAVIIVYDYIVDLQLKKASKIIGKNETIWTTNSAYLCILEIILLIPHPNIITMYKQVTIKQTVEDIEVVQDLNDFFSIWILVRLYLVIRSMLNNSIYSSTRSKRICRLIGCDTGHFYSVKCIFKEDPLIAVPCIFFLSVLVFGHALRIAEKPMFNMIEGNTQNFGNYINCFWCVIITMATVGYGDYYPKSPPGRVVIVLAAICGVVLISILVVALNVNLEMTVAEKKTNHVIKRLNARKLLLNRAAEVLTKAAKFKILMDNNSLVSTSAQKNKLNSIKRDLQEFRILNRRIKNMYDNSSQSEEMIRQFDFLKQEIKTIYENQNKLRDYLLKIKTNLNQDEFQELSLPSIPSDQIQE